MKKIGKTATGIKEAQSNGTVSIKAVGMRKDFSSTEERRSL